MPVLLHQQPVLTLALESFQDATIDENDIRRMWILFKKCKDDIKNGFRLENISWRIWYKKYLNNTSDLFSNNKIYKKSMESSPVHSVDSNSSSFSMIEPVEVLKKCACGEQLTSSSLNSLSTPQNEYNSFNKLNCHQKKTTTSSIDHTTNQIIKKETIKYSSAKLVKPSVLRQTQAKPFTQTNSKKSVEIHKEDKLKQEKEIERKRKVKEEKEVEEEREESNTKVTNEIPHEVPHEVHHDLHHDIPNEIPHDIPHSEINTETAVTNDSTTDTITNANNNTNANSHAHTNMEESHPHQSNTTHHDDHDHIHGYNIPPNCPTLEQFYQQQLLMLQQMYIQKQQQLQYQKQQMNINTEQVCQQQMYLQQWFNQQQQQLLSNCQFYYRKYIQQYIQAQAQAQARAQAQAYGQVQTEVQAQAQTRQEQSQTYIQTHGQIQGQTQIHTQNQPLAYNEDDYDEEEDEDDYYYSDEEDEDYNENINLQKGMKGKDREETMMRNKPKENDLFRKVSTNTLKSKITKPSLLSAMIKENNYNEYKKTIEIIQRYEEGDRDVSNNIYSIKDYNRNCINSLNKNARRRRVPSFEDIRNDVHGYKKLFEMHPLHPITNNNNNNLQEQNEVINSDIEEYYERNPYSTTGNGINNSYSTVNTINIANSQDSHTTLYFNHNLNGIYGSNKTTHSTKSTRSTKSCINNRINYNNESINLYMTKKRLNYSN